MLYIITDGEQWYVGVRWPPNKFSLQCRKSSLCTVSYDMILLGICWQRKRRIGSSVCVCNGQFVSLNFQIHILLFLLLFITFISISIPNLLYPTVSVLLVDTSPFTHIHTPLLDCSPFVNRTYSLKPPKDPLPRLDPSMRHKRN
jgi:hypothetical protein